MDKIVLFVFTFFLTTTAFGQTGDSCMLVGTFMLNHLEMSQEVTEKAQKHQIRWSDYENYSLADTLIIKDGFHFHRSLNASGYFRYVLKGQFTVRQDSTLSLFVKTGQLYTMPDLVVEKINTYELVMIEKFKSRWIRRTFRSNVPIRP
jgi:hypothetical protein